MVVRALPLPKSMNAVLVKKNTCQNSTSLFCNLVDAHARDVTKVQGGNVQEALRRTQQETLGDGTEVVTKPLFAFGNFGGTAKKAEPKEESKTTGVSVKGLGGLFGSQKTPKRGVGLLLHLKNASVCGFLIESCIKYAMLRTFWAFYMGYLSSIFRCDTL